MTQLEKVYFSEQAKIWFRLKLEIILLIKETTHFKVIHFLSQYVFVHNDNEDKIHNCMQNIIPFNRLNYKDQ